MSENTSEDRNNLFQDYKNENFDDSELQSRLYAEIYYEPNIGNELETTDISKTIHFVNINAELSNEAENIQQRLEEPLMYEDAQAPADGPTLVEIQTNTNKVSRREMNPVVNECDINDTAENPLEKRKKCKEKVDKKHKSNYVKNELLKKDGQSSESSDSEESIFEVPIPPKPKPPVINLHDSDEESEFEMDDLILEEVIPVTNCDITGASTSYQGTSSKRKNTGKSFHNEDATISPRNIHTHTPEISEDIVLNCTVVQKGARNINEIKQSSKSATLNKTQGDVLIEDTNQNSIEQLLQNTSKENSVNLQKEIFVTPGRTQPNLDKNNARSRRNAKSIDKNDTLDKNASCSNNDTTISRKRQNNSKIKNPKEKRQCIVQQNNPNVMQSTSSNEERRNKSSTEYFKTMSKALRDYYYNSSRGQENFDVAELQQNMSKDPRMWMIMDEDLMPSPAKKQRRFWNAKCTNCHQDGHQRYDCPVPRRTPCCYICGEKGHVEFRCPQKICLTCGKKYSMFRKTCDNCRVLYCTMCHSIGHELTQCPDLWRRYHKTTDMNSAPQDLYDVMKPSGLLHCCNCTKRGHESSTCNEYRWSVHFPTPAAVTNYMDGPLYTSFSDPVFETDILSSEPISSRASISYNPENLQQTIEEHLTSTNTDTSLLSNTRTNEMPVSQGTLCYPEIQENLDSPSMVNKILRSDGKEKEQNEINEKDFIIFSCGKFHHKNDKNAQTILKNLSLLKNISQFARKTINCMLRYKTVPAFLKALFDKAIEFEVKISRSSNAVMLQLIAMKDYIDLIYNLLLHWLNLPANEKDYGIDVSLPMNPTKMLNHLHSRMPQLEKMSFTCYNDHVQGLNDPQWLVKSIKDHQVQLNQHKGTRKQYSRLRTRMWRTQVKLLMIVNTEPKPNAYVSEFQNAVKQLESQTRNQKCEKLDVPTYLKLTLLYNHLFVPHTPIGVFNTLDRIKKIAKMTEKITNCPSQMQQQLEKDEMYKQDLTPHFNVSSSLSSAISCTSQNINPSENSSAINIEQNTKNETSINRKDMVDTSSTIDNVTNYNYNCNDNKFTKVEDSVAQDSQNIKLYTEEFNYDKPIDSLLIPIEDRNEEKLLISSPNVDYNTSVDKRNVNVNQMINLTKKEKWKIQRQLILQKRQEKRERKRNKAIQNMHSNALNLIKEARSFKLPHMMNAANELERKVNNQTIMLNHVETMQKMIKLEKKYRKNVSSYCKNLKA